MLLVLCAALGCIAVLAAGDSVNVSSGSELLAALQSPHADQIVLQKDMVMGPEFDVLNRSPLQITRCGWSGLTSS